MIKNGCLSSSPFAEFYEQENPVNCVALSGNAMYASSGADDGKVIIWDISSSEVVTSTFVSPSGR